MEAMGTKIDKLTKTLLEQESLMQEQQKQLREVEEQAIRTVCSGQRYPSPVPPTMQHDQAPKPGSRRLCAMVCRACLASGWAGGAAAAAAACLPAPSTATSHGRASGKPQFAAEPEPVRPGSPLRRCSLMRRWDAQASDQPTAAGGEVDIPLMPIPPPPPLPHDGTGGRGESHFTRLSCSAPSLERNDTTMPVCLQWTRARP
jgi:hypothetical protein